MTLREIKSIDVYSRWWRDVEFANPYYARKIVVSLKDGSEKVFTIKQTWGDVNALENDHLERILNLPKSVNFTRLEMYRYVKWHHTNIHTINYTFHEPIRIWKESGLEHPEKFRNI